MAASFTIAARNNGLTQAQGAAATAAAVRAYREAMTTFAQMRTMDLWYAHLSEDELRAAIDTLTTASTGSGKKGVKPAKGSKGAKGVKGAKGSSGSAGKAVDAKLAWAARQAEKTLRKAHTRDSLQALSKLGNWSTAGTGSSANPRWWSRPGTSPPPTR